MPARWSRVQGGLVLSSSERGCQAGDRPFLRQGLGSMRIQGERIKTTRWIHSDRYVVTVEVERVIPPDDPSEPCYESETVRWLREVEEHAGAGEVAWLKRVGIVYESVDIA